MTTSQRFWILPRLMLYHVSEHRPFVRQRVICVAELLDVYRAAILQIQQHMYHHPSLTLAGLQHLLLECQVTITPCCFAQATGTQCLSLVSMLLHLLVLHASLSGSHPSLLTHRHDELSSFCSPFLNSLCLHATSRHCIMQSSGQQEVGPICTASFLHVSLVSVVPVSAGTEMTHGDRVALCML